MDFEFSQITDLLVEKIEAWILGMVRMLPNLLLALIIFIAFLYAARILRGWMAHVLLRFSGHETLVRLASGIVFFFILAIGLFVSLGVLNLDKTVTSLLAGAGVLGLALGFAFQEIASNFIAGIFLAFEQPYRPGDIVKINEDVGTIQAINLRTTIIRNFDGLEVQVPNKNMFTEVLTNYTSTPDRRVVLTVGVSYSEDLEKVTEITQAAVEKISNRILHEPVQVFFKEFGESSINLDVRVWIHYQDRVAFLQAQHEVVIAIKKAYDQHGITIPFPIRTMDFGIKGGQKMSEELKLWSGEKPADFG